MTLFTIGATFFYKNRNFIFWFDIDILINLTGKKMGYYLKECCFSRHLNFKIDFFCFICVFYLFSILISEKTLYPPSFFTMHRSDYIFTASGFRKVSRPLGSYSQESQFPSKIKGTERTLSGIRSAASMLNKYNVNKHCITKEDQSVIKSHSMEKVFIQ